MNMFVSVRNNVTIRDTLPGIADKGMIKLRLAAITMVIVGK